MHTPPSIEDRNSTVAKIEEKKKPHLTSVENVFNSTTNTLPERTVQILNLT